MKENELDLEVGKKAIAKAGLHLFKAGTEIEFIGTVKYGSFVAYDFVGYISDDSKNEVSQHLAENEFELIEE